MTIENLNRIIGMRDTKVNIIALTGTLEEQAISYATDTGELGIYSGGSWHWFGGLNGQYRQFLYALDGLGDFIFLTDVDGNPLMALMDLE